MHVQDSHTRIVSYILSVSRGILTGAAAVTSTEDISCEMLLMIEVIVFTIKAGAVLPLTRPDNLICLYDFEDAAALKRRGTQEIV